MSENILIRNVRIIGEGKEIESEVLIRKGRFEKIAKSIDTGNLAVKEFDGKSNLLFPGIIDNHVHFREPGLTHKADIATESAAAVAGGVTSFMEMPNTVPQVTDRKTLEEKYAIARGRSHANFAFYFGATNTNLEEIMALKKGEAAAIKVFMGSSTGNMLVDDPKTLESIFANCPHLIAVHAEEEAIIQKNLEAASLKYGKDIPFRAHPEIRTAEGCFVSSQKAIALAKKHGTRLHVLHLTTLEEIPLFSSSTEITQKHITTEVCAHYLHFTADDYDRLGSYVKCNPAIKSAENRTALIEALKANKIDIICSDHAPHTIEEKKQTYLKAPSGMPIVQHAFQLALELVHKHGFHYHELAQKMCHNPALLYGVQERGYIREGYFADCFIADPLASYTVSEENTLYKCNWSPLTGETLKGRVLHTFVNGVHVFSHGSLTAEASGMRLDFE
jgi:dihydroorotase